MKHIPSITLCKRTCQLLIQKRWQVLTLSPGLKTVRNVFLKTLLKVGVYLRKSLVYVLSAVLIGFENWGSYLLDHGGILEVFCVDCHDFWLEVISFFVFLRHPPPLLSPFMIFQHLLPNLFQRLFRYFIVTLPPLSDIGAPHHFLCERLAHYRKRTLALFYPFPGPALEIRQKVFSLFGDCDFVSLDWHFRLIFRIRLNLNFRDFWNSINFQEFVNFPKLNF